MPSQSDPSTARLIIAYDQAGARVISFEPVDASPPQSRIAPDKNSGGAWIIVLDPGGTPRYASPLLDPRQGEEAVDDDGRVARHAERDGERFALLEIPYFGEGTHFQIHLSAQRETRSRRRGSARTLLAELAPTLKLPRRTTRAQDYQAIVHPIWGAQNPRARTLLFLPDGFLAAEMAVFRQAIDTVIARFEQTVPFKDMLQAMRVVHVEIPSKVSGIGAQAQNTAFGGRFTIERVIEIDQGRAADAIGRYVPGRSATAMIAANTQTYGGSGGAATVFSLEPNWMPEIAIHELGHGWFGLADEYSAGGQAATLDPVEPNVSGTCDHDRLKWKHLLADGVALPTVANSPAGVVGAFEGAKYHTTGYYRPSFDCKMRTPGQSFCAVCTDEIGTELARYMPTT